MGTGIAPPSPASAYQLIIMYYTGVDDSPANLTAVQSSPQCYGAVVHNDPWYTWLEFGGPGGTNC
jgi:hypothetical protein